MVWVEENDKTALDDPRIKCTLRALDGRTFKGYFIFQKNGVDFTDGSLSELMINDEILGELEISLKFFQEMHIKNQKIEITLREKGGQTKKIIGSISKKRLSNHMSFISNDIIIDLLSEGKEYYLYK